MISEPGLEGSYTVNFMNIWGKIVPRRVINSKGKRLAFLKNNKESRITELKWVKEKEENNIKEIMGTWSSRSFARTDSHCDEQSMFLKEKWDAHIYLTTTTTTKEIK